MANTPLKSLALASMFTLLTACQSTAVSQKSEEVYSGYLPNYGILQAKETEDDSQMSVWIDSDIDKSKYQKVYIEPVVFYPKQPTLDQASPEVLDQVKVYFNDMMKKELGSAFELTNKPGANTLKVEVAISAIAIDEKSLKAYQYIPIAFIGTVVTGNLNNMSVKMQVEAKISDATSGDLIAAAVKRGEGEKLKNAETQLTIDNLSPLIDSWGQTFSTNLTKALTNK